MSRALVEDSNQTGTSASPTGVARARRMTKVGRFSRDDLAQDLLVEDIHEDSDFAIRSRSATKPTEEESKSRTRKSQFRAGWRRYLDKDMSYEANNKGKK